VSRQDGARCQDLRSSMTHGSASGSGWPSVPGREVWSRGRFVVGRPADLTVTDFLLSSSSGRTRVVVFLCALMILCPLLTRCSSVGHNARRMTTSRHGCFLPPELTLYLNSSHNSAEYSLRQQAMRIFNAIDSSRNGSNTVAMVIVVALGRARNVASPSWPPLSGHTGSTERNILGAPYRGALVRSA
jgi:hypothetical protein